jgi:hypothetical protein
MWDLYTKQEVATFQLGWCINARDLSTPPRYTRYGFGCICPGAQNVLHGAWGTLALDTRSAYELPMDKELHVDSKDTSSGFTDVSDQKKRFILYQHFHEEGNEEDHDSDDEEYGTEGMNTEELAQAVSEVSTPSSAPLHAAHSFRRLHTSREYPEKLQHPLGLCHVRNYEEQISSSLMYEIKARLVTNTQRSLV